VGPVPEFLPAPGHHVQQRQELQHQPDALGRQLHAADETDPVQGDRDDNQRTDDVRQRQRQPEQHVQGDGHDAGFDGEQDERERGVDQRCDRRAHVAEAGAAGEQVDVDTIAGRVARNGQADQEHQQAEERDRPHRVGEAVGEGQRTADGLAREERDRPQRRVADPEGGFAGALRRVAQRVVLQGLAVHPLVVLAALPDDALAMLGVHLGFLAGVGGSSAAAVRQSA
jgi:hypothetical protein